MLNEEISEILKCTIDEITGSAARRNQTELLYVKIGGQAICCKSANAVRKAFRDFKMFLSTGKKINGKTIEVTKEKTMGQFSLKGMMYVHELAENFSNKNITDEKAIELLKANPKRIAHFDKYPANWQDIVNGKAPILNGKPDENPVTELVSESGEEMPEEKPKSKAKKNQQGE